MEIGSYITIEINVKKGDNSFMKKTLGAVLVLIALAAVCLTACGGTTSVNISRSTDTTAVNLNSTNDILTASLTGIPSAGYQWSYKIDDDSLIEMVKKESKDEETEPGMTGTSSTDVYTFKAKADGTVKISFLYAREWEQTDSDLCYEVEIRIENGKIKWMEMKNDEIPLPDEIKEFITGSDASNLQ